MDVYAVRVPWLYAAAPLALAVLGYGLVGIIRFFRPVPAGAWTAAGVLAFIAVCLAAVQGYYVWRNHEAFDRLTANVRNGQ
jgi:uncharacterized membrane protein (DUF485 family)